MFSQRIKKLRLENKKTQQQMADLIGVTRPAYTAYELGTREPDFSVLEIIASTFNVTTDYLLGRSDNPNSDEKKKYNSIDEIVKDKELHQWLFDLLDKNPESLESIKQLFESINNEKDKNKH
ncbi:helix-turn-helix transcriptional regulator [Listeria grandensis]|uniref:Helix-turn-helix transcriptional regulator n=1 Tax=Listeria grandensis TaxID=1494963 RepID=A0A7X0Y1D9_9LIST|nr:helix-turn-helix transcriptional regulator [Listeria grandensis]MBC1935232.1 helix-turn-helix transcriptional regulator [Listeria grandensis]